MLTQDEWLQLCQKLALSTEARRVAEEIRVAPPSRRVRSSKGNVSVRYPSRKMGIIIQAESHHNELAGVYEKEHDPDTLEYYDQPPPMKLVYTARSGRRVGVWHTPDYFVIRRDSMGWEEWKTEEQLGGLKESMPNRYVQQENEDWKCPPGEAHAQPLGFFYRVRSSRGINWIFQRNLLFLEDYLRSDCPAVQEQQIEAIRRLVTANPGMMLKNLVWEAASLGQGITSDHIYTLIAGGQLITDLYALPLAEGERVPIFGDEESARAYALVKARFPAETSTHGGCVDVRVGAEITWDNRGWVIVNVGKEQIAMLAEDGSLVHLPNPAFEALIQQDRIRGRKISLEDGYETRILEFLSRARPADFHEANRRYAILAPGLEGQKMNNSSVPARTIRSWLARWRQAEQRYGSGYVGLLPQMQNSGNHNPKLPERTQALMDAFITNDYETLKQKPKYEVYGALMRACQEQEISAPSYKTFALAVKKRPKQEQVQKRQGKRAAYQVSSFYLELTLTTPRHGDRPFEIAHIDHTQLDIELVCSHTGRNLGRPWATFLSDAFSRRLLAVHLTFDPPSYRSCMMVLRECVRRHTRLPQTMVVDGGKEFESIYFETLLARYECTKKSRPGASPRFGSVCERLFGTTNSRFIHNLMGNTQITRNVRQVTQAVLPQNQACWTLSALFTRLCEWAYEVYDQIEHAALGQTPREVFETGMQLGGQRPQRLIPYDESLHMLTLPTTRKGTARVVPCLGVKIHYIHYWAEAFLDPEVEGIQVPVRFDPFDAGTAYAFVKGRWVRCFSEHYARFAGHSEREMMLATAELRKRRQRHNQQSTLTARQLADFLASLEAEELLLEQRLRDTQTREVLAPVAEARSVPGGSQIAETELPTESKPAAPGNPLTIYEDY